MANKVVCVQPENLVTFLDFRLSQGSVATYCIWGGNLCDVYIENFLTNHLVKNFENRSTFAKVIIKYQVAYFFWETVYSRNQWLREIPSNFA